MLLLSKQDKDAIMFIKEIKVQKQTKLFYGTRHQNDGLHGGVVVNDENRAKPLLIMF